LDSYHKEITQLERIRTGRVQTNISLSDILNILIPTINNKIQTKLEDKIKESFSLKQNSIGLLKLKFSKLHQNI
jgi:type I restriction enzyme S subunit